MQLLLVMGNATSHVLDQHEWRPSLHLPGILCCMQLLLGKGSKVIKSDALLLHHVQNLQVAKCHFVEEK